MEKPGEGLLVRVYSYRAEIRGDAKGVINQVIITASLNGKRELSVGSSDSDLLTAMDLAFGQMRKTFGISLLAQATLKTARALQKSDGSQRVWMELVDGHVVEGSHTFCHVSAAFEAFCQQMKYGGGVVCTLASIQES